MPYSFLNWIIIKLICACVRDVKAIENQNLHQYTFLTMLLHVRIIIGLIEKILKNEKNYGLFDSTQMKSKSITQKKKNY